MATHIQIGDVAPRIQFTADGAQRVFAYPFPIFENADLVLYLDEREQTSGFAVGGAGDSAGGSVTFDAAPSAGTVVTLTRRLAIQRTSDFQESGEFRAKVLNDELDYLAAALQQVADGQGRALQLAVTETANVDTALPSPDAGCAILWNDVGAGFANGPNADEIANAQTYALAAQDSAATALAAEAGAAGSASAAANSAQAAATAAASNMFATNASKSADFAVEAADDGKQFLVDTAAGAVAVTLPEGAAVTDGFRIALAKTSADNNAVIVNRSGTDTINGGASWQFSVPHGQSVITLDTTPAPDTWFAAGVGLVAPVGVADLHDNAKPYDIAFAAGFDSAMTPEPLRVQTYGELVMTRSGAFVGEAGYADVTPAGAGITLDVLKNGVSIYDSTPVIALGANAVTAGAIKIDGTQNFASGDRITFKVTAVGSSAAGAGLRFTVKGVLN